MVLCGGGSESGDDDPRAEHTISASPQHATLASAFSSTRERTEQQWRAKSLTSVRCIIETVSVQET